MLESTEEISRECLRRDVVGATLILRQGGCGGGTAGVVGCGSGVNSFGSVSATSGGIEPLGLDLFLGLSLSSSCAVSLAISSFARVGSIRANFLLNVIRCSSNNFSNVVVRCLFYSQQRKV